MEGRRVKVRSKRCVVAVVVGEGVEKGDAEEVGGLLGLEVGLVREERQAKMSR